ncbi:MAG TPA: PfkB family carbohydrate kinase, partial [Anaerolineales bacterium]|nr:PfkB family carbohydrate kinase [Anaerolineales bacterium]
RLRVAAAHPGVSLNDLTDDRSVDLLSGTAALTGLPVDTLDQLTVAAAVLRDLGAQNVVVSLGKEGALLHTADGTWQAQSPRIQEKNPIGAGDSMVGGMVWSLSQGHALKDALGWGIASGAATAALS